MTQSSPMTLFPDLDHERGRLARSRACRDDMIERLRRVLASDSAADLITQEYIEMTASEAIDDLGAPGAGDFFGRIDEGGGDQWYIGRRHIEDGRHNPVVIDWRATVAVPFYRATVHDTLGLDFRRRFTLADDDIVAYLDEHLDDPDSADVAGGIPDPILAEIGAARTGAMREIVATIQGEQDRVIRWPAEGCLIVQGGPGTGKTAVGLHRAAYLLFERRRELARNGVLVVGPNKVFLDYISQVLPSLGERSVQQKTVSDLAVPKIDVDSVDPDDVARLKGDARMVTVLERAALAAIVVPKESVRVLIGTRSHLVEAGDIGHWIDAALNSTMPINRRREGFRAKAGQELRRITGRDDGLGRAVDLRKALDKAWPAQQPKTLVERILGRPELLAAAADGVYSAAEQTQILTRSGRRRGWTAADQLLVDEANNILNGPPATFGHIVVDEAQDLSDVGLRLLARRCPAGSFTVLGDLAQSTGPAGQSDWSAVLVHLGAEGDVAHLTIGYRVPAPILTVANRLLPLTEVTVPASRSVRAQGSSPGLVLSGDRPVAVVTAETVRVLKARHRLTGVVASAEHHGPIAEALAADGYLAVDHIHDLGATAIPMFTPAAVKGLEFDAVVVVNPRDILGTTALGARLLYVAMTRAVQELTFVSDAPLPEPIAD